MLKRRVTLTADLGQNVGLGEGYVGSFDPASVINQKRIQPYQFSYCWRNYNGNTQTWHRALS